MKQPVRRPWFDKWLTAGSPATTRLTDMAINLIGEYEVSTTPRRRKRREADERNHRTMVEAITMNLAHAVLMPPETGSLAVLLGKAHKRRTRYDHPAFGDTFATVLNAFVGIGWLTLTTSPGMGEASAISPTSVIKARVQEAGITLAEFRYGIGETITLKSDGERVDYPETAKTTALRADMSSLNGFTVASDLAFLDDGGGPVDTFRRQQRRYFISRTDGDPTAFNGGGRMFGGWWSNLPRTRRGSIRIEGEPVRILDFSSMFVRLAYARIGKEPPPGDLYAIPGLIGHRRATKLIINCMMFDEWRRRQWPVVTEPDQQMPSGMTMPLVRAAIVDHLPELRPLFGSGIGHELMLTESTILMEVLKELKFRGVPGLGLHDGLMVPASRVNEVEALMEVVSRQITSVTLPITVDPPVYQPNLPPYMRVVSSTPVFASH